MLAKDAAKIGTAGYTAMLCIQVGLLGRTIMLCIKVGWSGQVMPVLVIIMIMLLMILMMMLMLQAMERGGVNPDKGKVLVSGATGGVGGVATIILSQVT